MASNALLAKIARMREAALNELPKTRLCAQIVLKLVDTKDEHSLCEEIASLKANLGPNWSVITAFQFMSGQQAEFAAATGHVDEKPALYLAHLIAKEVCESSRSHSSVNLDDIDIVKIQASVTQLVAAST